MGPVLALLAPLALLVLPRAAHGQPTSCAPGFFYSAANGCTPCAASGPNLYSLGGQAAACVACPAGSAFVSSSTGCAPSPAQTGPANPTYFFSADQAATTTAYTATNPAGISFVADRFGTAAAAMALAQGSYLTTGALPLLPSYDAPLTTASWVKCAPDQNSHSVMSWGTAASPLASTKLLAGNKYYSSFAGKPGATVTIEGFRNVAYDGQGTNAQFNLPIQISMDSFGSFYLADYGYSRIRKVSATGFSTTLAGGTGGCVDGVGTNALMSPWGLVVDSANYVWFADIGCHVIRRVSTLGVVTTVAGHLAAAGTALGIGTNAYFNGPRGIAISPQGTLYICDTTNNRLISMSTLTLQTVLIAGPLTGAAAGSIEGVAASATFNSPQAIAFVAVATAYLNVGDVLISDASNNKIRRLSNGIVSSLVSNGATAAGTADGWAYLNGNLIMPGSTAIARLSAPNSMTFDSVGNLYIADRANGRIRLVNTSGYMSTIAGPPATVPALACSLTLVCYADGVGTNAIFGWPYGVVIDATGQNLIIADRSGANNGIVQGGYGGNMVRKMNLATGMVTTLAGNNLIRTGTTLPAGVSNFADGTASQARSGNLYSATAAWDGSVVYATDTGFSAVRAYYPSTGMFTTVAGFYNTACNYNSPINMGLATGPGAQLCWDDGIATDASGALYVYHSAGMVSKVNSTGYINRIAGCAFTVNASCVNDFFTVPGVTSQFQVWLNWGAQMAADPNTGNLYIADWGNNRVAMLTPSGVVTNLAGDYFYAGPTAPRYTTFAQAFVGPMVGKFADGTGTNAGFSGLDGVWYDGAANVLYVADSNNHAIRRVTLSAANNGGVVTTVAGAPPSLGPVAGLINGFGTNARFNSPDELATDPLGNSKY